MNIQDYKRISSYTRQSILNEQSKKNELLQAYYEIFKERLTISCENCVSDAIFRIKYHLKTINQKSMKTLKSKFKLKANRVIWLPKFHLHLTNDNLTDELAYQLLKAGKANLSHFETYPAEDVAKFFGANKKPAVTVVVDNPKTENPVVPESEVEEPVSEQPVISLNSIMEDNTKAELIEKLGDYPHEPTWSKTRLAEQLMKKLEEK